MRIILLPALALLAAMPALALALDPPVVADVAVSPDGSLAVELLFVNGATAAAPAPPPRLTATLRSGGRARTVELRRQAAVVPIAAGGFARVRYALASPGDAQGDAVLSLAGSGGYAFALPDAAAVVAHAAPVPAPGFGGEAVARSNPYLANLSTYNPIYGVFGPGTNTDGKLELSFQYQLFGDAAHPTTDWKEGIRFGYTQRMYWDLGRYSSPFRDVNYQPELFYRYALPHDVRGAVVAVRGGVLHQSNGRGGAASRSYNIVYAEPQAVFGLRGWIVTAAPRVLAYVGDEKDNPHIAAYRGHTALALSIERTNGIKLATQSRFAFGTGRGAIDADLSYPLLHALGVPVYAVVQGFTGYGEDLLDYDRRQNRVRVGLGIAR